jgi:hypothetical protein
MALVILSTSEFMEFVPLKKYYRITRGKECSMRTRLYFGNSFHGCDFAAQLLRGLLIISFS